MTRRLAVIDIGSNTIKINVADWNNGQLIKVVYRDFPSCLGRNLSSANRIEPTAIQDCDQVLKEIKKLLREYEVEEYRYIATEALRAAVNRDEILPLIHSYTDGADVEVISGEEETRLTLKAILIDLPRTKAYACINAGGLSTELGFYLPTAPNKEGLYFFEFGAISLYKDFIQNRPDADHSIAEAGNFISRQFDRLKIAIPPQIDQVVSVGGSIYNAAYIFKKDGSRNFEELANMKLSLSDLESVISQLKPFSGKEKLQLSGMDQERSNTSLSGLLIHYFLLKMLKKDELTISTRSISDGLIYSMAEI